MFHVSNFSISGRRFLKLEATLDWGEQQLSHHTLIQALHCMVARIVIIADYQAFTFIIAFRNRSKNYFVLDIAWANYFMQFEIRSLSTENCWLFDFDGGKFWQHKITFQTLCAGDNVATTLHYWDWHHYFCRFILKLCILEASAVMTIFKSE